MFNYNIFFKKELTILVQKIINALSIDTNINIIVIFNYIEFVQKYYNTGTQMCRRQVQLIP